MHGRAVSPAASENEFDISTSLFGGATASLEEIESRKTAPPGKLIEEGIGAESDDDGDELYIAAQQAASNRRQAAASGKGSKKSGGFGSMGLNPILIKAITGKGFKIPTPIQRKTIPLVLDGQDVVGMARTGSGKTAAFVIPIIEKLKVHSPTVGARAIILSPSRELALQTLKVVKEFGRGTDLRTILLVGGDSLEDQFSAMASNPDIIIATPGRFEHLKVEMNLELSAVRFAVFDEADRLFEMGFAAQLAEIMHSLPASRQTLLFSATLPKSLVEFARAGLQDPKLVRLDAESKMSADLQSAFFSINSNEKEGALLHVLRDVVKMPLGQTEAAERAEEAAKGKKRKRNGETKSASEMPTPHSTVVFAATKHHVDYLASLLKKIGYATSYVYGSLDQTARKMQVQDFRSGMTNIMVVTDVAARGLDIPILANVINYDFPPQPKIFVHRVGRTARAGRSGWSYNLITAQDMPYFLDLQLFLGKKLVVGRSTESANYAETMVIGTLVRDSVERYCEEVTKLMEEDTDLSGQRDVAQKGEKQYVRTRNSASAESAKRAKTLNLSPGMKETHALFEPAQSDDMEMAREQMLSRVSGFRPTETVFEIGRKGDSNAAADIMRKRRSKIIPRKRQKTETEDDSQDITTTTSGEKAIVSDEDVPLGTQDADLDEASEDELEVVFPQPKSNKADGRGAVGRDEEFFMSYDPANTNVAEDRGYGVHSGSYNESRGNFLQDARGATMDLGMDETKAFGEPAKAGGLRWDKKGRKYVSRANDEDGSKGKKMITGESGLKIAASLRSGRFDAWRKANKVDALPRVGEKERASRFNQRGGRSFKHRSEKAPKAADKFRDDFYKQRKKVSEAKDKGVGKTGPNKVKSEIRGVDDVRKQRQMKSNRKEKNARPSRKRA